MLFLLDSNLSCSELCLSFDKCVYYASLNKTDSILDLNQGTCIIKSKINIENGRKLPDFYVSFSQLSNYIEKKTFEMNSIY